MKKIAAPWVAGLALLAWASCKDEGVLYLTRVDEEAPGGNCVNGGSQLSFGADSDADGALTDAEVTASAFVCDGSASRGATVTTSALESGDSDCPGGGYLLSVGVDQNGDGAVSADEGALTRKLCNGARGPVGIVGPAGEVGPAGDPGPAGPQGDAGVPGTQGVQGEQGAMGFQGNPGTPGDPGAPGLPGTQGPPGDSGDDGFNSLVTVTPEPVGNRCQVAGVFIQTGLDDGAGGGTPNDGILQPGEVDDSAYACTRTQPPQLLNTNFEAGDTSSWTVQNLATPFNGGVVVTGGVPALEGSFGVQVGFEGDGGPADNEIFLAQDIDLTGFDQVAVTFDWQVPQCNVINNSPTLPRTFSLVVEPAGGGAALFTQQLLECVVGANTTQSLVNDQVVDISAVADQAVRIKFQWLVPESFTGDGELHLDDVKLVVVD